MPNQNTPRSQDIGGHENVYVPVFVDASGQYRRLPTNSIIDIAGVSSSSFTVGGKAVMLADGTASDGSASIDLQSAYSHSAAIEGSARILLAPGKDFSICDAAGNSFISVDAETGKVTINGEMSVISSIVKFLGAYQEADHLNLLSNDGLKTSLLIEPKPGAVFLTDVVRIRSAFDGAVDFSINNNGQTYIRDLIVDSINGVTTDDLTGHLSSGLFETNFKHYDHEIKLTSDRQLFVGTIADPSDQGSILDAINVLTDKVVSISASVDLLLQGGGGSGGTDAVTLQRLAAVEALSASLETSVNDLTAEVFAPNGLVDRMFAVEESISELTSSTNTSNVVGVNFEQYVSKNVWTIHHNTGSRFIQFTVYDSSERLVWPDEAFSLDANTFVITFSSEQTGRAILSCLVPPISTIVG